MLRMPAATLSRTVSLPGRMGVGLPKISPIGPRQKQHSKLPRAPVEHAASGGPIARLACTVDHKCRYVESVDEAAAVAVRRGGQ